MLFLKTPLHGQNMSATVTAGDSAKAIALPSAQQDFAVHLQATFSQNPDQGIALTSGSTQSFDQFAVTVRAIGSTVQARGPNGYPSNGFPFTPGVPTDLIITGNVPQRTFSAWMALQGQSYVQIANSVGIRAGNQPAFLDTLMVWADAGTISVNLINGSCNITGIYNQTILADHPVAFWDVNPRTGTEPDLSGNGNTATYQGGSPTVSTMPDGEPVAVFDGSSQYLSVPSNASLSIPTTGNLTWELWLKPTILQFPNSSGGYVDVMGKCADYSPTCEWEARMV